MLFFSRMNRHFRNETETQQKLRLSIIGKTVVEATEIFKQEPNFTVYVVWEDGKFNTVLKGNKQRLQVGVENGKIVDTYQVIECGQKSTYPMDWNWASHTLGFILFVLMQFLQKISIIEEHSL